MKLRYFLFIASFSLIFTARCNQQKAEQDLPNSIRTVLESRLPNGDLEIAKEHIYLTGLLNEFYYFRNFKPAWTQEGKLTCQARELHYQIQQSQFDGLFPSDYHHNAIEELFVELDSINERGSQVPENKLSQLDVLLSDAYMRLGTHLYFGKVDPEDLTAGWNIPVKKSNPQLPNHLETAIRKKNIAESLESLCPSFPIYQQMRNFLRDFVNLEEKTNQWKKVSEAKMIQPLERNKDIPLIRDRLIFWKDLVPYPVEDEEVYDSAMLEGVYRFQERYGLNQDGIIGKATLEALNESPEDLIQKVSVNLERLRWLPDTLIDNRFIVVNIANFQLDLMQHGGRDTLLTSTAIVGRAYRSTPVFSAQMSYLVFNPVWTVPPGILKADVLPEIKKDLEYLEKKHMKVFTSGGQEVDPNKIDWRNAVADKFPYLVKQVPGPHNSMGLVKFMFPNKYNVYIHDTPEKELFKKDTRAFSSGCIRIQKPFELAKILLKEHPDWPEEKIEEAIQAGKEQTVSFKAKIPVVVLYLSFWTDWEGKPQIRRDVYKRDKPLYEVLSSRK
ncbi:L,D-transpeptidase family protein [Echinicola jeungdonensis]|uniref:Murein L,D-transpeptidase n=1 Tax=Echinicola jeungdonensis TaxID=709343 RepID=A0ABV5J6F7_9BACT|nr:L,D-transpeptidase family protein [Echinicola jeungdonensis]MDN3669793.1 L,D-transpeptidase family protein [Echinicola jeungdonensis]